MAKVNPGSGPMTGLAGAVTADRRVLEGCPLGTGGARGAVWMSSSGGFAVYGTGGSDSTAAVRPSAERTGPREAENFCSRPPTTHSASGCSSSHQQASQWPIRAFRTRLQGPTDVDTSGPAVG